MTMGFRELLEEVQKASEISVKRGHRYAVILCTSELGWSLVDAVETVLRVHEKVKGKSEKLLVVGRSAFLEFAEKRFKGRIIHFRESEKLLGMTFDSLIIDLTEGFNPNDLGIIVETISGGGIIIAVAPPFDEWDERVTGWHEKLVEEPFSEEEIVPRFFRRFQKRTSAARGIIIYDFKNEEIIKRFEPSDVENHRNELIFREGSIREELYRLCATQDQIRVLELFEKFFEKKKERRALVMTANRGRGKTAVLGIVTPYLISEMYRMLKKPIRILVVAPELQSIQTYFEFLMRAMEALGMKYRVKRRSEDRMITVLNSEEARVEYAVPRRALEEKELADIIIVDEAAGIDVPVLWEITKGSIYTIFSSTIHGYEGAGRGFSVRFLRRLEEDESVDILRIHLDEPVRYSRGDPIESWIYDSLLLDAQPAEITEEDIEKVREGEIEFEEIPKDLLVEDERLLREFFGIYVLAHYRNRPSDLVILLDMPNHLAFRVKVNEKTICSLHVAIEGALSERMIEEMSEGYRPKGQVIPDVILKHFWKFDFPKLRGLRVVRIATHPSLMNMGIGSFALQKLVEEAISKSFHWVGSGFGLSSELLRFWMKSGFIPVHITPQRNEISGEYSVIVLRALKEEVEDLVKEINRNFIKRFIEYLGDELRDLETSSALLIFDSLQKDAGLERPAFTEEDRRRIEKYLENLSKYEYIVDIVRAMTRYHFSRAERAKLKKKDEYVLVAKCLQARSWNELMRDRNTNKVYKRMRNAIERMWRFYYEDQLQ
ncbi:MAG: tRNA(Met) cytidine acetyltransferase [Archaeoglobi archaeon]|nr:tRNA(Met) cytidine acetyltransferase [Archaeoglobi archaeon]